MWSVGDQEKAKVQGRGSVGKDLGQNGLGHMRDGNKQKQMWNDNPQSEKLKKKRILVILPNQRFFSIYGSHGFNSLGLFFVH